MSLRDKNKALVVTDDKGYSETSGRSLRTTATGIAKPTGRALGVVMSAASRMTNVQKPGRIGFLVDATGSRVSTWEQAQVVQAQMFRSVVKYGKMSLRLMHFGGSTLRDHGWKNDPDEIVMLMSRVECDSGKTQILRGLRLFLQDSRGEQATSIILTGDSYEEEMEDIGPLTNLLKGRDIKVFSFLEQGHGTEAETAFKRLAEETGGVFAVFGDDMPLKDLCEGVAVMATGGADALQALKTQAARTLLLQMRPK